MDTPIVADADTKIHPESGLEDQIQELAKQGDSLALRLLRGIESIENTEHIVANGSGRGKAHAEKRLADEEEKMLLRLNYNDGSPRQFGIHIQTTQFHYDSDIDTPGAKVARIRLRICEDVAQDGRPESVDLKSRDDLASQTKFLAAYAEMSGVMPARRKNAEWQEVLGAIFANISPVYPGDKDHATDTETSHWVREYIDDHQSKEYGYHTFGDMADEETKSDAEYLAIMPVDGKWPFTMGGNRYLFLENVRLWIDDHKGVKLTPQDLAVKLTDAGYNKTVLRMGRYQRRVWVEWPMRKP